MQIRPLLARHAAGETTAPLSLDLGLTETAVSLTPAGLALPDGAVVPWADLEEIAGSETACYRVAADGSVAKIQFFSAALNRFYSLMPTSGAPTMLISGFPMHRIKGTDPWRDTLSKIRAAAPLTGAVLDTTMGLGYTAIAAAETAASVLTLELDPTVVEVCRANPWSQALFTHPRITRRVADAAEAVAGLESGRFARIIHDPPTFSLAGELYGAAFYRELHRVLAARGRLFHYVGDPDSKSGRGVTRGVVRRLQEAGFRRVQPAPAAFGVVAFK